MEKRRPRAYVPSGRFGRGVLAIPLLLPLMGGLAAAHVHGLLSGILGDFRGLSTGVLGLAVAVAAGWTLKRLHSRSPGLNRAVSLLMGTAAWYLSWVFFLRWVPSLEKPDWSWLADPTHVARGAAHVARWGWSEIAAGELGAERSGAMPWLSWAVDAAVLIGFPVLFSGAFAGGPYCERCGRWLDRYEVLFRLAPTAERPERLVQRFDLDALARETLFDPAKHERSFDILGQLCECKRTAAVTVSRSTRWRPGREMLIRPILVPRKPFRQLLRVPARIQGEVLPEADELNG